jgi:hypothetical protein
MLEAGALLAQVTRAVEGSTVVAPVLAALAATAHQHEAQPGFMGSRGLACGRRLTGSRR